MTLLGRVVAEFERARIACALCGAGALAVHGIARSTFDIDLLTTDPRALHDVTWQALNGSRVQVEIRRGDDDDPLRGVVRVTQDGQRPVDVIVGRHAWQTAMVDGADASRVLDTSVRVVDAPSLILLKLYAGGPQDLWDVQQLLLLGGDEVVRAVDASVAQLPAASHRLWKQLRGPS